MKSCRRLALAAGMALGALVAAGVPAPARAQQAVVCANCATNTNELFALAKQAQQYALELQKYQLQLQQYMNMVTNTLALPQQVWSTVQGDIMQVQNLSNAASLLSGNSGSMISRLQSASGYVSQVGSLGNIPSQITMYQQTIGDNLSTMGRTLGIQQGQEASNSALLASLQAHSQSAAGQLQAIQAGNELAHQQATQLLQIQATLSSTAQMQATQMAVDADRDATATAAMLHFNSAPLATYTGGKQW